MKQVALLLSFKVHVILVFDGASLPAKQKTNDARNKYLGFVFYVLLPNETYH